MVFNGTHRKYQRSVNILLIEFRILQVQLEMYKGGHRVAYATFNATGADKMGWFSMSRLVSSSWSDVFAYAASNRVVASVEGISG